MENFIIKFKHDLKQFQIARKQIIKQCEFELKLLERLIDYDANICFEYTIDELDDQFVLMRMFSSVEASIHKLIHGRKREKTKSIQYFKEIYNKFSDFYTYVRNEYNATQSIINAYENDKIKDPINDISTLFAQISHTSLTVEEISKIIGMAISFNNQYAKKHKDHKIQNIDTIKQLSEYYNPDGTFKHNEDIETFAYLIKLLDNICLNEVEILYRILNLNKIDFCKDIIALLKENSKKARTNQTESIVQEEIYQSDNYTMSKETIKALQELRKYYKNGTIIAIPENLEEFYKILRQCELDENEQKYIINLINEQISNQNTLTMLKYLDSNQQIIYQRAISLLNTFNHSNGDVYALKQYIEELQTISNMLDTETDKENNQYLLNDVPTIIEQLSLICDRYTVENNESTNRFIFLLNKNGVPYIYDDIDALEQTNQKAIFSLISKIDKPNQSQFRKIISNEPLSYNMYEVINTRAHIAFVEVDAGIYVIVGADIPRNGYKELNNRLKANQSIIKQIEIAIKNPQTRNEILKSNEEYLETFTEQTNSVNIPVKLTLKAHN